uniref:Uncharacterized protein n=1 Tax=Kalanchoe fedtschenkoi TaxID=63787 RepID=A0A7N0VF94_KALFE
MTPHFKIFPPYIHPFFHAINIFGLILNSSLQILYPTPCVTYYTQSASLHARKPLTETFKTNKKKLRWVIFVCRTEMELMERVMQVVSFRGRVVGMKRRLKKICDGVLLSRGT